MGGKVSFSVILSAITLVASLCVGSIWLVRYISSQRLSASILIGPAHASVMNKPLAVQRAAIAVPLIRLDGTAAGSKKHSHHKNRSTVSATPELTASSSVSIDPELAAWIANAGQELAQTGRTSPGDEATLDKILKVNPRSCRDLIAIGFSTTFKYNPKICAMFYAAAIEQGHEELRPYPPGDPRTRPILIAMNGTKHLLWTLMDRGDRQWMNSLSLLYGDSIHWIAPGDTELQNERIHAYVGQAECLYLGGKLDQAISAAEAIDTTHATRDQRAAVAWIDGNALYVARRYPEASQQFRIVAADERFDHCKEGAMMLVYIMAKQGDTEGANRELDDYIRRFHATVRDVAPLLAAINKALTS